MSASEWIEEATEVLDLVGTFPDTGSAEDLEFRARAPYFMREALDALGMAISMLEEQRDYGTDYDAGDFLTAIEEKLGVSDE